MAISQAITWWPASPLSNNQDMFSTQVGQLTSRRHNHRPIPPCLEGQGVSQASYVCHSNASIMNATHSILNRRAKKSSCVCHSNASIRNATHTINCMAPAEQTRKENLLCQVLIKGGAFVPAPAPAPSPRAKEELDVSHAVQLLGVLVDEQRHVGQLPTGRRRGEHVRRQAVGCVVHEAVRDAAGQRQVGALARGRQDLGLPRRCVRLASSWVSDITLPVHQVRDTRVRRQHLGLQIYCLEHVLGQGLCKSAAMRPSGTHGKQST